MARPPAPDEQQHVSTACHDPFREPADRAYSAPPCTVTQALLRACSITRAGLILVTACSGCALNGVGTVASRAIEADGAWVVETYVVGAHLRTSAADGGLSLGITKRSRIYGAQSLPADLSAGWRYGSSHRPRARPVALDALTYGLEGRLASYDTSLTVGAIASTVLADVQADETVTFDLQYEAARPEATRYRDCMERHRC